MPYTPVKFAVRAVPYRPVAKTDLITLVGKDSQVDQYDYGASVEVELGETVSGEILALALHSSESGTGAVQKPAGTVIVLSADPATTAGDTAISLAERRTIIGQVIVVANDWKGDANGATAYRSIIPVAFHELDALTFLWYHEEATAYNDGEGDDEILEMECWYVRHS